ncbi:hypothetical protein IQ215_05595 [Cyanobacterium stanieri LEGE 03274]|uniref:Uncharacterized protein n=1 Tax=Cyanobacterium stanieri LEGE 03274 TaxID=1828756 RepID=A0ABR9V3P4_9CHRO|nr:hypothetical protein [Cyanobacterium stanieri]MBE9222166.1 hypothetical protein [Cyanobacterium stanieri LEGE 03274]
MDKTPNNKSQNIVLALVAVAGFSVAHQSGLAGQLLQVLDKSIVQSASAKNTTLSRDESAIAPSLQVKEIKESLIQLEGDRAYQIDENAMRTPLQDGFYRFANGEILTVQDGTITNRQVVKDCIVNCNLISQSWNEGGTWAQGPDAGPWSEAGWREGGTWERDASGDDQMRRTLENNNSTPRVRDSFDRIQINNDRTSPRIITPVDPNSPLRPPVRPGGFNTTPQNNINPNFGR